MKFVLKVEVTPHPDQDGEVISRNAAVSRVVAQEAAIALDGPGLTEEEIARLEQILGEAQADDATDEWELNNWQGEVMDEIYQIKTGTWRPLKPLGKKE